MTIGEGQRKHQTVNCDLRFSALSSPPQWTCADSALLQTPVELRLHSSHTHEQDPEILGLLHLGQPPPGLLPYSGGGVCLYLNTDLRLIKHMLEFALLQSQKNHKHDSIIKSLTRTRQPPFSCHLPIISFTLLKVGRVLTTQWICHLLKLKGRCALRHLTLVYMLKLK